jgi:hypothetical protein
MVRSWLDAVKLNLLPALHAAQSKTLAALSFGMAQGGSCCSGLIAAHAPSCAKPASTQRRVERLLANQQLDATAAMLQLAGSVLRDWSGRRLLLILDETPRQQKLRCLKLSVAYHKRTVPLLGICYRPDRPPMPMPKLVRWMLRQVAAVMPPDVQITLLADRGLCWPTVIRQCRRLGWHYLLRLQSSTRVLLDDGSEKAVRQLLPCRGSQWLGPVRIFKKARWLKANVIAVWEARCKDRWLLVSDQPASYRCCASYCKRTWCEESHRDEKSSGLNWQNSRVNDPQHAQRLVLLMALASLLCISTGAALIKRGLRRWLDPHRRRRRLSVFQLGRRWLAHAISHDGLPIIHPASLAPP